MKRLLSCIVITAVLSPAAAQEAVRFIGCPVYRDTDSGRKSGCWLADDPASGLRFDLQQSHTKPQLGQEVLVEGRRLPPAQRSTQDCGFEVLERPRVSVLPGQCPAVVWTPEGLPGKAFVLPGTVMTANHLPQPMPAPPWRTQHFDIGFDHGDDYLLSQHAEVILQEAVRLARLGNARRVIKTIFMFSLYLIPYFLLISGITQNGWVMLGLCAVMGLGMAGIGLSIMHDANHGRPILTNPG